MKANKSSSSCTWPLTSSRALWMAKLNRSGMRAVTEFGQTEVGQLYLTEFGQPQWTEFSLTFLVFGTRRGKEAEGLGPRTFGAPQGGAPIWCNGQEHPVCFSLSRRELRSQRHGPPKVRVWAFLGPSCASPAPKAADVSHNDTRIWAVPGYEPRPEFHEKTPERNLRQERKNVHNFWAAPRRVVERRSGLAEEGCRR